MGGVRGISESSDRSFKIAIVEKIWKKLFMNRFKFFYKVEYGFV